jgi:hypothetical protein
VTDRTRLLRVLAAVAFAAAVVVALLGGDPSVRQACIAGGLFFLTVSTL